MENKIPVDYVEGERASYLLSHLVLNLGVNPQPEVLVSHGIWADHAHQEGLRQKFLYDELHTNPNTSPSSPKQQSLLAYGQSERRASCVVRPSQYSLHGCYKIVIQRLSPERVLIPLVSLILLVAIVIPVAIILLKRDRAEESPNPAPNQSQGSAEPNDSMSNILDDTNLSVLNNYNSNDLLFYQTTSGSIQFTFLTEEGFGEAFDLRVSNAKNHTPLASISQLRPDGSRYWWVFYVNNDDIIQGLYSNENSQEWLLGSINGYNIQVSNRPNIAFTIGHRQYNANIDEPSGDFSFCVCTDDGMIREYIYNATSFEWRLGFTFRGQGCGFASIAETGSAMYLFIRNTDSAIINTWSRRHNSNSKNWTKQEALDVAVSGGLCAGHDYIAFQGSDGGIEGRMLPIGTDSFTVDPRPAASSSTLGCRYSQSSQMVSFQLENGQIVSATSEMMKDGIREDWAIEELVNA